jgi:hypothetical protein
MKNIFFSLIFITGFVCITNAAAAQQLNTAKQPQVKGPVLQNDSDYKTPVPAAADANKLHETAGKPSSFSGELPVKAKDQDQPAKAPESKPLPETNKLVVPNPVKVKNG